MYNKPGIGVGVGGGDGVGVGGWGVGGGGGGGGDEGWGVGGLGVGWVCCYYRCLPFTQFTPVKKAITSTVNLTVSILKSENGLVISSHTS